MRNLFILFISQFLFGLSAHAQYNVDWPNAPYNPIPEKYTLDHFNIKGKVTSKTTETEAYTFNKTGQLTTAKRYEMETYTYNNKGMLQSKVNERGDITTYICDTKGRILQSKNSIGSGSKYSYNSKGLLSKKEDLETGNPINHYTYDAQGSVIKNESFLQGKPYAITTYIYKKYGKELEVEVTEDLIDQHKNVDTYNYNQRGDCTSNMGYPILYTYDKYNNILTVDHGYGAAKYSYTY